MSTTQPATQRELRFAVTPLVEARVTDEQTTPDGSWLMQGYAAVFDERTTLFDGELFRVTEEIDPGAFDSVLERLDLDQGSEGRTLVHLNYGHDMQASVASTDAPEPIGRLMLEADERGLRFQARVDQEDPDVRRMANKMRRGIVNQASFAFTIAQELAITTELEDGRSEDHYRILEVGDLFDVCACPRGAYQQTVSNLRSLAAAIGRSPQGEGHPGRRFEQEGAPRIVVPENPAGGSAVIEAEVLSMRRRRIQMERGTTT